MSSARACGRRGRHGRARRRFRGLAERLGAEFRFGRRVVRVLAAGGRATGVETDDGERIAADAIVWNGDVAALADGGLGAEARRAVAAPSGERSLSAMTLAMTARVAGFPLVRHNVFFSRDAHAEFDDLFARARLPEAPTVYVCAEDRGDADGAPSRGPRARLLRRQCAGAAGEPAPCRSGDRDMRGRGVQTSHAVRPDDRADRERR